MGSDVLDCLLAGGGFKATNTLALQECGNHLANGWLVVNNQHCPGAGRYLRRHPPLRLGFTRHRVRNRQVDCDASPPPDFAVDIHSAAGGLDNTLYGSQPKSTANEFCGEKWLE